MKKKRRGFARGYKKQKGFIVMRMTGTFAKADETNLYPGKNSTNEESGSDFSKLAQNLGDRGIDIRRIQFVSEQAMHAYLDMEEAISALNNVSAKYRDQLKRKAGPICNSQFSKPGIFTALLVFRDAAAELMEEMQPRYIMIKNGAKDKVAAGNGDKAGKFRQILEENFSIEDRELYTSCFALEKFVNQVDGLETFRIRQQNNETGPVIMEFLEKMFAGEPLLARTG
jgi:hypothetical protein